jgi:hypothetical protein
MSPNDSVWQGVLLGLGDDGVTYHCQGDTWQPYIPPLNPQDKAAELASFTEQRDEARIELEKYTTDSEDDALYNVRRLRKELTAVTEQRDEALNQLRKAQVENDHNWQAMELYESEREQRDRLAEALQMINSACQGEGWTISELRACCSSHCNEALQSITPNEL